MAADTSVLLMSEWLDEPTGPGWYWVAGWLGNEGPAMIAHGPNGWWGTIGDRTRFLDGSKVMPIPEPDDV